MMFIAEIEYIGGRFAGRPILLRALSYFNIKEKDIESADRWLTRHGPFSIFISTFVPYFRNVASLAAGVLGMNAGYYTITSLAGYSIRAVLLLYFGYLGMDSPTPSFDYSHRLLLTVAVSTALLIAALARRYRSTAGTRPQAGQIGATTAPRSTGTSRMSFAPSAGRPGTSRTYRVVSNADQRL